MTTFTVRAYGSGYPACPQCGERFNGRRCDECGLVVPYDDLDNYDRARDERLEAELERREG